MIDVMSLGVLIISDLPLQLQALQTLVEFQPRRGPEGGPEVLPCSLGALSSVRLSSGLQRDQQSSLTDWWGRKEHLLAPLGEVQPFLAHLEGRKEASRLTSSSEWC
jgi:hypothetical protein